MDHLHKYYTEELELVQKKTIEIKILSDQFSEELLNILFLFPEMLL